MNKEELDKRIELEALITTPEGYIAENNQRLACGHSVAYGVDHFQEIAEQIRALKENP